MNNLSDIFTDCFLASVTYPDHEKHKDQLITFIKEYDAQNKVKEQDFVSPHIKYNLAESSPTLAFFEEADNIIINDLQVFLETAIYDLYKTKCSTLKYHKYQRGNCKITESWYHITKTGGYHDIHDHTHSSFSAIYFLDVEDCGHKNGGIRFYKPFKTTKPINDIGLNWIQNDMVDFVPKSGQIIIFPGFLEHAAIPYHGKSDRYAIAVNAKIAP